MTRYGYRIGLTTSATAGTGTLSSSGVTLTGAGTNFDPELVEGSVIIAAGQTLCVATVTDDDTATVVTAPSPALSGATFTVVAMTNIETLLATMNFPPRSSFKPWADSVDLGNGTVRAMGRPSAVWQWGYLPQAHRNTLRAYCTGKSAAVLVRTRKNDTSDAYVTYSATMVWPDEEDRQNTRRLNFSILFKNLVAL